MKINFMLPKKNASKSATEEIAQKDFQKQKAGGSVNVETKFDVGDKVYSVVFDKDTGQFVMENFTIAEVAVLKNRTGLYIRYCNHIWGADSRLESDLFQTPIECLAECQRRNAGLSYGR